MFRTKYDSYAITPSCPGTHFENDYKMKVFEDGSRDLVAVGKIDVYNRIQSFKDSVDLKVTLERFANGDQSAINRRHAFFGDFTHMPTSLAELSQRILDANDLFNSLDLESRRAFDFDAGKFFASIGTPEFEQICSKLNANSLLDKPIVPPVVQSAAKPAAEPAAEPVAAPVAAPNNTEVK